MNYRTTSPGYSKMAKFLHWSIALMIIFNFILGLLLGVNGLYSLHKQIGVAVISLAFLRILWRLTHSYPAMVASLLPHEKKLAQFGHLILYIFMLIMPLSGIVMSNASGHTITFLGLNLPVLVSKQPLSTIELLNKLHGFIAYTFMAIVALHILAALKHHFIDRSQVLTRMLPFSRNRKSDRLL